VSAVFSWLYFWLFFKGKDDHIRLSGCSHGKHLRQSVSSGLRHMRVGASYFLTALHLTKCKPSLFVIAEWAGSIRDLIFLQLKLCSVLS